MNLSNLLNIHKTKVFNQTSDETVLALDKELDHDMLENLYGFQQEHVLRKEPQSYKRLRALVGNILKDRQEKIR